MGEPAANQGVSIANVKSYWIWFWVGVLEFSHCWMPCWDLKLAWLSPLASFPCNAIDQLQAHVHRAWWKIGKTAPADQGWWGDGSGMDRVWPVWLMDSWMPKCEWIVEVVPSQPSIISIHQPAINHPSTINYQSMTNWSSMCNQKKHVNMHWIAI